MVPGSNLLRLASRLISLTTVQWYHATGRTKGATGLFVTNFAAPLLVKGSFQPVPRNLLQMMGLDFNKEYVSFYTDQTFQDVARDTPPDEFILGSARYSVLSNTDWTPIDGWRNSLAVKIS